MEIISSLVKSTQLIKMILSLFFHWGISIEASLILLIPMINPTKYVVEIVKILYH